MHLVHEVRRLTHTRERATRVDVVLPRIDFLVVLERKIYALFCSLDDQAVRLEIDTFDIRDVAQSDDALLLSVLHVPHMEISNG